MRRLQVAGTGRPQRNRPGRRLGRRVVHVGGASPDHPVRLPFHPAHDRVELDGVRQVISEDHDDGQSQEQQGDGAADGKPREVLAA